MNLSAEDIARAVDSKARFSGGQWRARCPVHRGNSQNFYVKDGHSSTILHCFRGCEFEELVDNLRSRGLWPDKKKEEASDTPTFTKDELEFAHLFCRIYQADVKRGVIPTKQEDARFRKYADLCYKEGVAYDR